MMWAHNSDLIMVALLSMREQARSEARLWAQALRIWLEDSLEEAYLSMFERIILTRPLFKDLDTSMAARALRGADALKPALLKPVLLTAPVLSDSDEDRPSSPPRPAPPAPLSRRRPMAVRVPSDASVDDEVAPGPDSAGSSSGGDTASEPGGLTHKIEECCARLLGALVADRLLVGVAPKVGLEDFVGALQAHGSDRDDDSIREDDPGHAVLMEELSSPRPPSRSLSRRASFATFSPEWIEERLGGMCLALASVQLVGEGDERAVVLTLETEYENGVPTGRLSGVATWVSRATTDVEAIAESSFPGSKWQRYIQVGIAALNQLLPKGDRVHHWTIVPVDFNVWCSQATGSQQLRRKLGHSQLSELSHKLFMSAGRATDLSLFFG